MNATVAKSPLWLRLAGAAILLLAALPLYRLLDPDRTGLAGRATVEMAAAYTGMAWSGLLLVFAVALLGARALPPDRARRFLARCAALLAKPSRATFALMLGVVAFVLTRAFSALVLADQPNFVDTFAQLVHARYFAGGRIAGPVTVELAFQTIQQMIVTPAGWLSQYPPGHLLVLAFGFLIGDVWSAGALMIAITAVAAAFAAERLLPERRPEARIAAILVALSPMLIAHGGALLSHATAAALGTLALLALSYALERNARGAIVTGLLLGMLAMTRPLTALAFATAAGLALFAARAWREILLLALACLPGAVAMFAYNAATTGDAFVFGYQFALGDAGGLGWGVDPWGNTFGPIEAIAYVSAELHALSIFLLETPAPLIAGVALFLLLTSYATSGLRVLVLWALIPLAASLLYWHHGLFMGPRMLSDTAPAWIMLVVVAGGGALRAAAARTWRGVLASYAPLSFGVVAAVVLVLSAPFLTLMRFATYRTPTLATTAAVDAARANDFVFVHGAWPSRVAMSLAAEGVALATVERLLTSRDICALHELTAGPQRIASFISTPPPATLQSVAIGPHVTVRRDPGRAWSAECRRQARADLGGAYEIAPVLWRSALPGLEDERPLVVRDLGPDRNRAVLQGHDGRRPLVALPDTSGLRLVDYPKGMRRLWAGPGSAAR